jgi:putative peptidoglycan binding protein/HlyD family secretion protein
MRSRIWVALVVAVAVVIGVVVYSTHRSSASTRPLIITAAVTRRTLQDQLTLTGTLSRLVQRTVTAGASGQISDVSVADGDTVSAGHSIIGINGREMVAEPGTFPFFRSLTVGDSGEDVKQLDQILASSGYDPGPIGTTFTNQTQAALAQWQAAHGYPGVTADKPKTLTVSLQPSGAYQVGPESSAGLIIDSSSEAASQSSSISSSALAASGLAVSGLGSSAATSPASGSPGGGSSAGGSAGAGSSAGGGSSVGGSAGSGSSAVASDQSSTQRVADAVLTSRLVPSATMSVASPPPTLTIYALNPVTDKGSPAVFIVYASTVSSVPVTFSVAESGSAPADEVLPPVGPFTIPPGASSVELQVPTRVNDLVQPDAQLSLQLAAGNGYVLGSPNAATTTIKSADVPEINLTGGGTVAAGGTARFTITADQPPVHATAVSFEVAGTAQPGQDFQPLSSTIILPAGQTSVTVSITTINSGIVFQPTDMITGSWPIRVGQVFVKAGDIVAPGAQLFTLTDTKFTVTLSASPSDRTQLQVGQSVTIQLQGGSAETSGVISQLDDYVTVNPTTNAETYQGKISVGNLGAADGATVTITVTVQAANNVLTVPIAAVKQNGLGRNVVRVIDLADRGRVTEVPVTTGISDSSYIQIETGLTEGQVVIVETDNSGG